MERHTVKSSSVACTAWAFIWIKFQLILAYAMRPGLRRKKPNLSHCSINSFCRKKKSLRRSRDIGWPRKRPRNVSGHQRTFKKHLAAERLEGNEILWDFYGSVDWKESTFLDHDWNKTFSLELVSLLKIQSSFLPRIFLAFPSAAAFY